MNLSQAVKRMFPLNAFTLDYYDL